MKAILAIILTLVIGLVRPSQGHATPSVTLSAQPLNQFRYVLLTFDQSDIPSMAGCHYNLFAADKSADLLALPGRGRSIATFFKTLPRIQILSGPLPHLRQKSSEKRSSKIYLRTLMSCTDKPSAMGDIVSIAMRRTRNGTISEVDQLTRKMKHSMQYYGDAVGQ